MKKILIIAAHPDDEVLGCGGVIAKQISIGADIQVVFMADGISSRGFSEELLIARKESCLEALKILGVNKEPIFFDLKDNQLDAYPLLELVQKIEKIYTDFLPDVVYTHNNHDLNIDHQITFKAVMTAARPISFPSIKEIYSFEVLSSSEWSLTRRFNPNLYVDITNFLPKKIEALKCYDSELSILPNPRSISGIENLSKVRGSEVGVAAAETFEIIRLVQ